MAKPVNVEVTLRPGEHPEIADFMKRSLIRIEESSKLGKERMKEKLPLERQKKYN